MQERVREAQSFGGLVSQLTFETASLFRKEIELARSELSQKVSQAGSGLISTGIGGIILFIGIQALVASAILGLALFVDWWLAALIVGVVITVIGALILRSGIAKLKAGNLVPRRTIGTLRENTHWAREQLR
ncbi:MAG: phage holin family protein [Rhodospirillales bacterium]|nr:phage holin family protein [Rhodospirillales bacterium]